MSDAVPLFKTHKTVFILSLGIFAFFGMMILFDKLGIDFVLLGVIREMLTLPAFLLIALLIPIVIYTLWKLKPGFFSLPFYSFLLLALSILLIITI